MFNRLLGLSINFVSNHSNFYNFLFLELLSIRDKLYDRYQYKIIDLFYKFEEFFLKLL